MQEDYDQSSKSDCSSYSLSPKRLVGFDAKNKDSLSSYICFVCTLLLRYPVQLICGHRLCQSCVNVEFLRTNIREHFLSQQHQHVLLEFLTEKIQHLTNNKDDESIVPYSTTKSTDRELDESSHVNLQQLFETMDIVISGLNVLNDDTQRLTSESFQYQRSIQSLSEDVFRLNTAIKETHSSINDHINSQQIIEEGLTSLQQQLDDQKNISHNGTLIWKITNIQQKIGLLNRVFFPNNV
ncbi:unnamed protein product [Rotaria sp. Silwood2]|nr:unnamed protein product [Rotaria sp. Silwood2]